MSFQNKSVSMLSYGQFPGFKMRIFRESSEEHLNVWTRDLSQMIEIDF